MTTSDQVRLRLTRAHDKPISHQLDEAWIFGLQDTRQEITPGERLADGTLAFDFILRVKPGKDPDRPMFNGPFASGPVDDRFVYLSWRSVPRGVYINRLKARLSSIDWTLVRAAQAEGRRLSADTTHLSLGDPRQRVDWCLD